MNRLLHFWWLVLRGQRLLELTAGVALLAGIVVAITTQVFTRYVFNRPIVWVEDAATFAFIWSVFLGAAVGLKDLRHVKVDTFLDRLNPRARSLVQALLYAVILACCLVVARQAWGVMDTEARSETISLPINVARHWFYSVPLFYALLSMAMTAGYFLVAHLRQAATGAPVEGEVVAAERIAADRAAEDAEFSQVEKVL
jgi:TRAP-type C4-dicarboxylate transport system permease small subunit